MAISQEKVVEELKKQWKRLWQERINDKVRAEGIAINNYSLLFVEKGTIICATKDYKSLNLKEIINQHQISNPDRYISINPQIGGLTKFIKKHFSNKYSQINSRKNFYPFSKNENQHKRKNGRGWLHK